MRYQHPKRGPSQDAQGVPQEAYGTSRCGGGLLEKLASRGARAPISRNAHLEKRRSISRWQHPQRELLRMHGHVSQEARSASREERAASREARSSRYESGVSRGAASQEVSTYPEKGRRISGCAGLFLRRRLTVTLLEKGRDRLSSVATWPHPEEPAHLEIRFHISR